MGVGAAAAYLTLAVTETPLDYRQSTVVFRSESVWFTYCLLPWVDELCGVSAAEGEPRHGQPGHKEDQQQGEADEVGAGTVGGRAPGRRVVVRLVLGILPPTPAPPHHPVCCHCSVDWTGSSAPPGGSHSQLSHNGYCTGTGTATQRLLSPQPG